jgi:hypothetical protein
MVVPGAVPAGILRVTGSSRVGTAIRVPSIAWVTETSAVVVSVAAPSRKDGVGGHVDLDE